MTISSSTTVVSDTTASAPPTSDVVPRIAVVLGGGWKLGSSFHAGVLLALRDEWGIDARLVDSLTGTSAGALTAGFVASGMNVDELFRREVSHDRVEPGPDAIGDESKHHGDDGDAASGDRLMGWPRDRRSGVSVQAYFDRLLGESWPIGLQLRLCAVDIATGRLIALDASSGATPGQAVAASCSVPGLAAPVRIAGRTYIDGAARSINNAGSVASMRPDIVIVSAPLSIDRPRFGLHPMTAVRNTLRLQTEWECRKLARTAQVVVIEPTRSDAAVMGTNLNAAQRRGEVARHSYQTARDAFARHAHLLDRKVTTHSNTEHAASRPSHPEHASDEGAHQ